ncbi:hypothetical protein KOR34_01080 [Posidoniimonas corsicana]|uniref:Uncharacterized protein n=1 Tax=Posidoniimonas corsicana TaxID=1938618 RepID=A0A5C5VB36_9BACT|nr:hypothetical protein [Posidoniimonas corsicana]TWT35220.1 hypothetical protein KOR34_01080 [Posidoniimonas corsicana]
MHAATRETTEEGVVVGRDASSLTLCDAGFVGQREGDHVRYVLVLKDGGCQDVSARLTCLDGCRLPLTGTPLTSEPLPAIARSSIDDTPELRAVEHGLRGGDTRYFSWRIGAPPRRRGVRYFGLGVDLHEGTSAADENPRAAGRPYYYAERVASKLCLGAAPAPITSGFFLTARQAERRLAELARIGTEHGVFSRTPDEVSCDTLSTLLLRMYAGSDLLLLSARL